MTKFTFTYGTGDWTLSAITETMQEALHIFDQTSWMKREAISRIREESVDPRNYAEEVEA